MGMHLPEESANELSKQTLYEGPSCIVIPPHLPQFFPKSNAHHLLESVQYHGFDSESPHDHLDDFKQKCQFMRTQDSSDEAIYLTMFPLTLKDHAKNWLRNQPQGALNSWESLKNGFLGYFFPRQKIMDFRNEILNF